MIPLRSAYRAALATAASLLLLAATATAQPIDAPADSAASPAEQRVAGTKAIARAEVQADLDQLDDAAQSYLEGIDLITSADGEFAPALIDAYRGLAGVFTRRGDFPEAVTVLEQARHVSNRNFGLFNLDQADILDDLSGVYEAAGDTRAAQASQREILNVAVRHFGGENRDVVPYHYRLGAYYELARMRVLARAQYEQALEIVRDDPQAAPGDALRPLSEIVRVDTLLGEGVGARRDLREVLESAPGAPAQDRAEALAVLGDAALATNDLDEARHNYAEAHAALGGGEAADTYFRSPRMINFIPPPAPVDWGSRRRREVASGSITARFTLSEQGRAERIEVVTSDPPGLMDARYVERLAEAVFRPRIAHGVPVTTGRLRYSHQFRYFLPDEDE